ncbi:MAG: hypothetical protein M2R45_01454 [Verrucomicrobia subdivision 3 bacterium]|nr:hypothetical protein [Limisphaerales bacterium]MCS1417601.1 hypothetical protein [Limisphaerales bacterium]
MPRIKPSFAPPVGDDLRQLRDNALAAAEAPVHAFLPAGNPGEAAIREIATVSSSKGILLLSPTAQAAAFHDKAQFLIS